MKVGCDLVENYPMEALLNCTLSSAIGSGHVTYIDTPFFNFYICRPHIRQHINRTQKVGTFVEQISDFSCVPYCSMCNFRQIAH